MRPIQDARQSRTIPTCSRAPEQKAPVKNNEAWLEETYEAATGRALPKTIGLEQSLALARSAVAQQAGLQKLVAASGASAISPDAIATGSLKAISTAFKAVAGPIGLALMHSITGPGGDSVMQSLFNTGEAINEKHHASLALEFVREGGENALDDIRRRALQRVPGGQGKDYRMALLRELYSPPGGAFHKFDRYRIMMQQGEAPVARQLLKDVAKDKPISLTFPGSGSLPLTVDLLSIELGDDFPEVRTNLIDIDPEAIDITRRMLDVKEKLGIQRPGTQRLFTGDAGQFEYRTGPSQSEKEIETDVLFLAAALPTSVTGAVVRNAGSVDSRARQVPTVMGRSALGLSQKLYEPLDFAEFQRQGLEVEYQAHPIQHLLNETVMVEPTERDKVLLMDEEVVNSLYGFRRGPGSIA